jgi:hypothetical protein
MKIKLQTILIMAFLLALQPAYAQYAGGNGRGDFALTAAGLQIFSCTNPTVAGSIGTNQTICYGTKPSALTSVTLPSNYGGTLEYKWQYSTDSLSFTDIDHDSIGYVPGTLTDTTWYKRLVRVDCKTDWVGAAESNVVKITVLPDFTAGSIKKTGETICYNGDPAQIGDSIPASGGDASISYQWQSSLNAGFTGTPTDIGTNAASYDPPTGLLATTWYRRQAKDETCNTSWNTSAEVWKVTIHPKPVANAGTDASIVEGETHTLSDASAENYTSVSWTTSGDGSFSSASSLTPVYTPGLDDIAAGEAELCLTAVAENPCTVDSVNCMTLTIQRHPTISITSPVTGSSVYSNPVTISGTAADADDNLDKIQVKLNGGTWQTATGTDTWTIDLDLVAGKNTILARAKDATDLYSDTATINVLLSIQVINIPQGWSAISSYLTPLNPALPVMMDEITNNQNLVIMLSEYGVYWPSQNYNTIGNWNVEKGYKVKMTSAQEFTVRGDTLVSRSINLTKGYHIIPVLSNVACPVSSVFADPLNDIFFMYDVKTNALYWPQGEIFNLTSLLPGKGYIASFNKAVTLTYPAYSGLKSGIMTDEVEPALIGPWPLVRTADVHFVSLKSEALNTLENIDFIGAFDSFGSCIGYAEVDGRSGNYLLTMFGNDETTDFKDGGEAGEPISFRAFNSSTSEETTLIAEFNTSFPNADGLFVSNGMSEIIRFKESATGIGETGIVCDIQVYPNPAKDVVNINLTTPKAWVGFKATLISAEGKVVNTFTISGIQTILNVQDLQPGIYILKFENAENVVIKRLVIQ